MTVVLFRSATAEATARIEALAGDGGGALPGASAVPFRVSIAAPDDGPDPAGCRPGVAAALETAFDAIAAEWWALGRGLAAEPSARLAHAPACTPNASDLGLMLAWTRLVDGWAAEPNPTHVVCGDPWLFRHLAGRPGVEAATPPPALAGRVLRLQVRGAAARLRYGLRAAIAALRLRGQRRRTVPGGAWLLVYGHPRSTADGQDAYFGALMHRQPGLRRVLHVDASVARATALGPGGTGVPGRETGVGATVSLHGWGHVFVALGILPFARWRPGRTAGTGPYGWLVRRAAALEGGTAQAAALRWQQHCQARWLADIRPRTVAWPWENHAWERVFVRAARALGCATVGYQHSVIGGRMLNYAPASNPDGPASLPDAIACSGPATRDQLARWSVPETRLSVAGALRFPAPAVVRHDPAAPVFLALPFDGGVAAEMVDAARAVVAESAGRWRFLVKDHPMTPFAFAESPGVERTEIPLGGHGALAAVVFAATTVGLEALLAGLPTLRFRPRGRIAIDILPPGATAAVVEAETLARTLTAVVAEPAAPVLPVERVFAAVDWALWRRLLSSEAVHDPHRSP